MRLIGKELYIYKEETSSNHCAMHSLQGTFVKTYTQKVKKDAKQASSYWPIGIKLNEEKARIVYLETQASQDAWVAAIQKSLGVRNFF